MVQLNYSAYALESKTVVAFKLFSVILLYWVYSLLQFVKYAPMHGIPTDIYHKSDTNN